MSSVDVVYVAINGALWLVTLYFIWKTQGTGHEIRRMVVAMSDELETTYLLSHDLVRMAADFVPDDKREAWRRAAHTRFGEHQAHVRRARKLLKVAE